MRQRYGRALYEMARRYLPVTTDEVEITYLLPQDEIALEITHERVELVLYTSGAARGLPSLPFLVLATWDATTIDKLMVAFAVTFL